MTAPKMDGTMTYDLCGNPPYAGDKKQSKLQKADIQQLFSRVTSCWKSLDYICGFIYKSYQYILSQKGVCGLVSTNSIVQGQQVPRFWSMLLENAEFCFAVNSFKWSNLATNKAGVILRAARTEGRVVE